MTERLVIGCMSGTSCDAVDAAAVRVTGVGLEMRADCIGVGSEGLGESGERLHAISHGSESTAGELTALRAELGRCHITAIESAMKALAISKQPTAPDLIACHGQTLFHRPPWSWQMFDTASIARRFGCPIVCDLRAADLAAGGEGAPITPIADWVLYRGPEPRTIVNLGGFCNITALPSEIALPEWIEARDVCPCNQLLDAGARLWLDRAYDSGGQAARSGAVDDHAAEELVRQISACIEKRVSLGSGDEAVELLSGVLDNAETPDKLATLCDALGRLIARACPGRVPMYLAGGGRLNLALVRAIERHSPGPVSTAIGGDTTLPVREAVGMAVLGALSQDGLPVTLSRVTGVNDPAPIAGVWTLPPDGSWEVRPRG